MIFSVDLFSIDKEKKASTFKSFSFQTQIRQFGRKENRSETPGVQCKSMYFSGFYFYAVF